jgi:hypothetical protein
MDGEIIYHSVLTEKTYVAHSGCTG